MIRNCLALGLALTLVAGFAADDRPRLRPLPADSRNPRTGPPPGARMPNIDLPGTVAPHQTLDTLRGPKGLVLLFVRSADWSAPCKAQIIDFDRHAPEFHRRGLGMAVVSYDSLLTLQTFAHDKELTIPLLSDAGSSIIKAFGLLNPNLDPASPSFGSPFPGAYVLDERGTVTAKYFLDDPSERYSAAAILAHELAPDITLRDIARDTAIRTVLDTPQLTLTWSASDAIANPGNRVALTLDIDPKPKMRIIASGSQGYIPLEWQMGTSRSWLASPVPYPAGRILHLTSFNEMLPFQDHHIRLVRDVVIGQENEIARSLTPDRDLAVEGTFRFQACDDKECFPPRSVLLRWTFKIARP